MRHYKFHHIDSFTNTLFGGNPTVTVLNADTLNVTEMKKIAREMNLSETSFLLKSDKADFRLRFFTPQGNEIKFCGHATVGALCTIARDSLFDCVKEHNFLTLETNAGILKVEVNLTDSQNPKYIFDAPKIELSRAPYTLEELIKGLGISADCIDHSKPLLLEKTNNYLYLTAHDLKALGKINLDASRAIKFAAQGNIVVICILTNQTFDPAFQLHARGFAPLVGILEDPFTGSMQGGLAAYALNQGMIQAAEKWIHVEQGHFIGRPGSVQLEVTSSKPIHVRLHSQAVHLYSSTLTLPEDHFHE